MITIDYNPLAAAIVESWRRTLPLDAAGRPLSVTNANLRDLISRLCVALEVLGDSRDTAALLTRVEELHRRRDTVH